MHDPNINQDKFVEIDLLKYEGEVIFKLAAKELLDSVHNAKRE